MKFKTEDELALKKVKKILLTCAAVHLAGAVLAVGAVLGAGGGGAPASGWGEGVEIFLLLIFMILKNFLCK